MEPAHKIKKDEYIIRSKIVEEMEQSLIEKEIWSIDKFFSILARDNPVNLICDPIELSTRLLTLLSKTTLSRLHIAKILLIFRREIGLPCEIEGLFKPDLLLQGNETSLSCSRFLLGNFFKHFNFLKSPPITQSSIQIIQVPLNKIALDIFNNYLHKTNYLNQIKFIHDKTEFPSKFNALQELLNFSQIIKDNFLQTYICSKLVKIASVYIKQNYELNFKAELLTNRSKEFAESYFQKNGIGYKELKTNFSISLGDYIKLFSINENQELLQVISRHVEKVVVEFHLKSLDYEDLLKNVPKKHRNEVLQISASKMSNIELAVFEKTFPNSLQSKGCLFQDPFLNAAFKSLTKSQYEEAKTKLEEAIMDNPTLTFPREVLGNCLKGQKRLDEAEIVFREVIKINPERWFPYSSLGLILLSKNEEVEAIEMLKHAIELNPKCKLYRKLIVALIRTNQKKEAEYYVKMSAKYHPADTLTQEFL